LNWRRLSGWLSRRCRNARLFNGRRFFFDSRFDLSLNPGGGFFFNLRLRLRFNARRFRFWRRRGVNNGSRFHHWLGHFNFKRLNGHRLRRLNRYLAGVRLEHSELLSKLVSQTVFDSIGVRRYRHTHVLQFADNLGIVAIQFTG